MKTGMRDCFVVMPLSSTQHRRRYGDWVRSLIGLKRKHDAAYWKWFLEDYLKPVLNNLKIDPRPSVAHPGSITKDIMQSLAYTDLVFAVTTDENPNVFYELGIRHACRHGTIILMEHGLHLPFDLKDYGTVFYSDTNPSGLEADIRNQLNMVPRKDSPPAEFLQIKPNMAINVSIGTLRMVVREIAHFKETHDEALFWVDKYDKLLGEKVQITVLAGDRIIYHRDRNLLSASVSDCWQNIVTPGKSFFPDMQTRRTGLQLGQIRDRNNRMTAIAFETLINPEWLVVVEAHYFQTGESLY